jgi:hypothetical protein
MYRLNGTPYTRRLVIGTVAAVLVCCSVAGGLALAVAQTRPSDTVTLSTVSAATLAASRETLTLPSTNNPAVTAQQADAVAVGSMGGPVREHALANLTDTGIPGMTNKLVWVVSVGPPGGFSSSSPLGGQPMHGTYTLVFVDATTGNFLYASAGGPVTSSSASNATSK